MIKKAIHFLKYNNATLLILALIFIASSGVWAQTEAGQEFIGENVTHTEGVDNTLLLEANLDNFDMDMKIEGIEEDEKYYYVVYTYLDLVLRGNAWIYEINEKERKVSKKLKKDLGEYIAEELAEEYDARVAGLKVEQEKAQASGEETRTEVSEYSGLIGKTLKTAEKLYSCENKVN